MTANGYTVFSPRSQFADFSLQFADYRNIFKKLKVIDDIAQGILFNEVSTPELRFAIYGCLTYLRPLETDESRLINALNTHQIKSYFFFGERDKNYLPAIGNNFFKKYTPTKIITLNENHEMINANFASTLADLLL